MQNSTGEKIIVSVIIPLYNEENYVDACLKSLCAQTYPMSEMEWLLVDGMSTDKTVEVAKKYCDEYPVKILTNEKKKTAYALNKGIEQAQGKYIVRMDAHSVFEPDYIEKCIYYLENTDAANVGGVAKTKSEGFVGNAIAKMLSTRFGVGGSDFRIGEESGYVDTVPFGAFRKEIFEKVGLFNPELIRSEDNDMNARIRACGEKIYLAGDIHFTYYCRDTVGGILKMAFQNGNALFRTMRINKEAMSLRHFIPFFFVLSLIVLPIMQIFLPWMKWVMLAEGIAYTILNLWFSFGQKKRQYGLVTIWLYPLFHICYGLGSLLGLFGVKLY